MPEPKTKPEKASVTAFIAKIADEDRRKDCTALVKLMSAATGEKPRMWGSSIVGFGSYPLRYASGREVDWPVVAFSPRKGALVLYNVAGLDEFATLGKKLGKHTTGKGCLYIQRLEDIDQVVLKRLVAGVVKAKAAKAKAAKS
jgi:hypothetical protein